MFRLSIRSFCDNLLTPKHLCLQRTTEQGNMGNISLASVPVLNIVQASLQRQSLANLPMDREGMKTVNIGFENMANALPLMRFCLLHGLYLEIMEDSQIPAASIRLLFFLCLFFAISDWSRNEKTNIPNASSPKWIQDTSHASTNLIPDLFL